jgi:superfamily II DNA or RNA helicase
MGLSTYKIERYFKLIDSRDDGYAIPRGFLGELINFLNEKNIKFVINDERKKCESIKFENNCKLYDYQQEAVKDILSENNGVLVAPPGAGKTIMGIEIISQLKQTALILVHKKQIFSQWLQRIESFMNIPKREIGQICANKKTIGEKITVAMIQTLSKSETWT